MRYAERHQCPACRGAIADEPRCPGCGYDLTTREAAAIWQHLLAVDALLETSGPVPGTKPTTATAAAPMPLGPRVDTGTVILLLGAGFLLISSIVFVSFTWSSLHVVLRGLILVGVTGTFAALAAWVTRRRLRFSAESLWALTCGLVVVDLWAAHRSEDLLLDRLPAWAVAVLCAAALVAVAGAVVELGRAELGTDLVGPQLMAVPTILVAAITVSAAVHDPWRAFWAIAVSLAVPAVAAQVGFTARLPWLAWGAVSIAGVVAVAAVVAALAEATTNPHLEELLGEMHGLPLLVVAVVAATAASWPPLVEAGTAAAITVVTILVAIPLAADVGAEAAYVWGGVVAVALASAVQPTRAARGVRIASIVVVSVVALASLGWIGVLIAIWLDPAHPPAYDQPRWVALAGGAALAGFVLCAARWARVRGTLLGRAAPAAACSAAGLGLLSFLSRTATDTDLPLEVFTGPCALLAWAGGVVVLDREARLRTFVALSPALVVTFGPSLPLALTEPVTVRALAVGLVALALVGLGSSRSWQAPFTVGSAVLGLLAFVELWPLAEAVPRWVLIGAIGGTLLAVGMTWEQRVNDGRRVVRYVAHLR